MPIRHVHDVRDLLIHVVGQTLRSARHSGRLADTYPELDVDERCVAHVLDGITKHSLQGMLDLRERQGWKQ